MNPITQPAVAQGCPKAAYPSLDEDSPADAPVLIEPVEGRPEFQINVFVLGRAESTMLGGAQPYLRLPFEMACSPAHVCWEVSTAVYISEDGVRNPKVVLEAMESAAGYRTLPQHPAGRPE